MQNQFAPPKLSTQSTQMPPVIAKPVRVATAKQVVTYTKLCAKTIYTLTQQGRIPCMKIGRSLRYDLNEVDAFLATCRTVR
jgi:excisionase family DNA binding protein